MSRRNNQNNQYNGNQYYGNGQYYNGNNNGQYYNQNGQYNQNMQYNQNGQYNQNMQYNQNGQYNNGGNYYNQNGQYPNNQQRPNKFGLYNQPGKEDNNDKQPFYKNPLIIKIAMFVGFAILLILIVIGINSCGRKEESDCEEDFRKVGSEGTGYVCVPSDWVNFQDEDKTARGLQYSNVAGTYILTLDYLPTTDITAREYALGVANNLEKIGITVQGSETKIGDYFAYEVYGQQANGEVWVLVYFFEADDGNTHYLGVEGPDKTNEAFKIPESFMLK